MATTLYLNHYDAACAVVVYNQSSMEETKDTKRVFSNHLLSITDI
jgi:hypothetical protein